MLSRRFIVQPKMDGVQIRVFEPGGVERRTFDLSREEAHQMAKAIRLAAELSEVHLGEFEGITEKEVR